MLSLALSCMGHSPEIMVAGSPENFGKTFGEFFPGKVVVFQLFANITGDNKPVLAKIRQIKEQLAVLLVT